MTTPDPRNGAPPHDGVAEPGPLAGASARLEELLTGGDDRALRLWAPSFVALDRPRPVAAAVGASGRGEELRRLALERRAFVVATDVDRGTSRVVLVGSGGHPAAAMPPVPGFEGGLDPTRRERTAQVVGFTLWPRDGAPWPTGTHALVAVAGDRTSGRVTLAVGNSASTVDPSVEPLDPESLRVWPPPDPAGGLPRYHALEQSPAVPAEPGIAMVADRVARAGSAAVYGAFRARLRPRWVAPHGAIVPLTLVLTGSEDPRPLLVTLRLPSFDPVDPASPPATVTGHFAVDVLRLAPLAASRQTYFLHAFSSDGSAGPLPIAVSGAVA